jgi:hypothetical protein
MVVVRLAVPGKLLPPQRDQGHADFAPCAGGCAMNEPQFNEEEWDKNVRSVFNRLAKAKWIADPNPVDHFFWWKDITALGLQKVGKFSDALILCAPDAFKAVDLSLLKPGSIRQPSVFDLAKMTVEILPIIADLQPPPFAPGEIPVAMALFYTFAREHGKNLIPPATGYRPPPV